MDDDPWCRVIALQLYDWVNLADKKSRKRGCVGFYCPAAGKPNRVSVCTDLEFDVPNQDRLNRFAIDDILESGRRNAFGF